MLVIYAFRNRLATKSRADLPLVNKNFIQFDGMLTLHILAFAQMRFETEFALLKVRMAQV
jgi:hypothetical protein